MGTPQRQVCEAPSRRQRRLELGGDLSGSNAAPSIDAHHNSLASSSAECYRFSGVLNQVCFPFQLQNYGFGQPGYPFVWESTIPQLPTYLQPMPVPVFRPELQNTHCTLLQGAENSRNMHSDCLAASQEHSFLTDQPAPNRPASVSYEPTLQLNPSTMEPNQPTPLPNHPDRLTMGPNQLAKSSDKPDRSVILPNQPAVLLNQPNLQSSVLPAPLPDHPSVSSDPGQSLTLDHSSPGSVVDLCTTEDITSLEKSYPDLVFVRRRLNQKGYLEVTQLDTQHVAGVEYVCPVRALFIDSDADGVTYDIQVLLNSVQAGTVKTLDTVRPLIDMVSQNAGYKFCPGLQYQHYFDFYFSVIRYHINTVRLWERPFQRVNSIKCVLLHQLPHNATMEEKRLYVVLCKQCKRLRSLLEHQRKRSDVSPERKLQRQQPSSRFKLKYLSPFSTLKRRQTTQRERSADKGKLAKYKNLDVTLDDGQNDEWNSVIKMIEEQHNEELDKVFQEADARSKHIGNYMRTTWQSDRCSDFLKDQQRNQNRKRGNRWSPLTIRIALAVFIRSPAAYEALKSFNVLQLPSRSTIQSYTGAFLHKAGASSESIIKQLESYEVFKESCARSGKSVPKSDGVLIFDEVKVVSSLMWNSRNHQLIGLAMSEKDQASLLDIYQLLDDDRHTKMTNYILQFLWRDLTSGFDIVGPYFTSEDAVSAKFISACVFETIRLFQVNGLRTSLLICDGAAPNLTFLKATHGKSGMYGVCEGVDRFEVKPWFPNPCYPSNNIYWLICPSHQLKNMINALYSSQEGGARSFQDGDGIEFGWKAIVDMFSRECQRRDKGHARMVPKLREIHVLRDSWTKLNVFPAKIMQQEQVLTELNSYVTQIPPPEDADNVRLTLRYLEACKDLFEDGFLSHQKISSMKSEAIVSILNGFSFFEKWYQELSNESIDSQDPRFLSWQTWDLLRVCVYGFMAFATWYFDEYPEHFLSPVRLSGSAVETLFSQFKSTARGKLSAMNYATARAAHLVKHAVTPHHSSKGYRDSPLDLCEVPLEKKKYEHTK